MTARINPGEGDEFQQALFARDEGIARAQRGAPTVWFDAALHAVTAVARRQEYLTSEDVRDWLRSAGVEEPPEGRALGPVMLAAARTGVVTRTGRVQRYTRRSRHTAPANIWQSQINGKATAPCFAR